jgi:acetyl esterase/lipase
MMVASIARHLQPSAVAAAAAAVADLPVPLTEVPPGVEMTPDVTFLLDSNRAELADLYQPSAELDGPPRAAIVFIHGGGWVGGDKDQVRSTNVCSHLALHGYTCLSINYLLASDSDYSRPAWPQNYHDCQRAVQWLREHAAKLNIDPNQIGVCGGSAGGHLAHLVALAPPALAAGNPAAVGLSPTTPVDGVCCCVNLYGPTSFMTGIGDADKPPSSQTMFEGPFAEHRDVYRQASPETHIHPDNPPVFLVHGTADDTVDIRQLERYYAKAREWGAPVQFRAVEGAPHAFHLEPLDGLGDSDLKPEVFAFFEEHLGATAGMAAPDAVAGAYSTIHLHMMSHDAMASARFYERMFGAVVIASKGANGLPRANVSMGGLTYLISQVSHDVALQMRGPHSAAIDHVGLGVADIGQAVATLRARGSVRD